MKRTTLGAIGMGLAASILLVAITQTDAADAAADDPVSRPGIAVVELFTSEGCSSCPPADRLLSELARQAAESGAAVYPLSFHVDYWDRLGWKDPFSARDFTDRQYGYALSWRADQVYTPQAVVNGRWAFVGSDAARMAESVKAALEAPRIGQLTMTATVTDDVDSGDADVEVRAVHAGLSETVELVAVVAERDLSIPVPRGENAGRTLAHDNVVRVMEIRKAGRGETEQAIRLRLPAGANPANSSAIVFVQRTSDRFIINAAAVPLKGK